MKFEEIFKEPGLYVSDTFTKGTAIRIKKGIMDNELEFISYKNAQDLFPEILSIPVYARLFKKDYQKVLIINQLFKS